MIWGATTVKFTVKLTALVTSMRLTVTSAGDDGAMLKAKPTAVASDTPAGKNCPPYSLTLSVYIGDVARYVSSSATACPLTETSVVGGGNEPGTPPSAQACNSSSL